MRKPRFSLPLADMWRPSLSTIIGIALLVTVFTFRLGGPTGGLTTQEVEQRTASSSVEKIIENPMHLGQKSRQFAVQKFGHNGPIAMRSASAVIGILAVISMFILLKNWHTTRVALLGTILFATSSWLLHTARLATPDASYLMPILLLVGGIWLQKKKFMIPAAFITGVAAVLLMYVPGMVWLVIPAVFWQRRLLKKAFAVISIWWQAIIIILTIVGLAPLVWALFHNPELTRTWLGLPATLPSLPDILGNLINIPKHIFISGSGNPIYGIANIPLLDIMTSALVLLGCYSYGFRKRLDRTRLLLVWAGFGSLLIALDGPVSISFLLPLVYIVAASGVALLLQRWLTVFPRNPFARITGIVLLCSALSTVVFYHISHYFIAWPNVPETKYAFRQDL